MQIFVTCFIYFLLLLLYMYNMVGVRAHVITRVLVLKYEGFPVKVAGGGETNRTKNPWGL